MHITGIVAEYNPFHNGHLYQLTEIKKQLNSDFVIAVMSGNFSQRGLPTIADKFIRTEMALASGIDLVLELPVPYSTASAERFSEAAISIFHKSGLVHSLCFGSESGDLKLLNQIAALLNHPTEDFSNCLKNHLRQGESFPQAREKALLEILSKDYPASDFSKLQKALSSPNNILGIEYIKALKKYKSHIVPHTLKRVEAHYHETEINGSIASATAIRTNVLNGQNDPITTCMPASSYEILQAHLGQVAHYEGLSSYLHYKLMVSQKEDLYSLWDIPKELIHSIYNAFTTHHSIHDLVDAVTSKTYTRATVQRSLFRILLHLLDEDMKKLQDLDWIPYIRVLGCRKEATCLLGLLHEKSQVPVITNLSKVKDLSPEMQILLNYEQKATALYHSLLKQPTLYKQDFTQAFIKK